MRYKTYYYLQEENVKILKIDGTSSTNLLNDECLVLSLTNIGHLISRSGKAYLKFKVNNTFSSVIFKLVQIKEISCPTYDMIMNQIYNEADNIYLGKYERSRLNNDTNNLEFDITNIDLNHSENLNIVLCLETSEEGVSCDIDISSIKLIVETIVTSEKPEIVSIDDNKTISINAKDGNIEHMDNIYTYKDDLYEFPIILSRSSYPFEIFFYQSFPFNISFNFDYTYFDNDYGNPDTDTGFVNLLDYTGYYKRFKKIDPDGYSDYEQIGKIKEEFEECYTECIKEYVKSKGGSVDDVEDLEFTTTNVTFAKSLDSNSFLQTVTFNGIYEYPSKEKEEFEVSYTILIDENKNAYFFLKNINEVVDSGYKLSLIKMITPENKELSFITDSTTGKITNIYELDIWFEYSISDYDLEVHKGRSLCKCIDFKKDKRRINFNYHYYLNGLVNPTLEYTVVDYSNEDNEVVLKECRVQFNNISESTNLNDIYSYTDYDIVSFTNLITKEYYEIITSDNTKTINKYLLEDVEDDSKILLDSLSLTCYSKYSSLKNNKTGEETIYLMDKRKNLLEVICENKTQTSNIFNDDLLLTKSSSKCLMYDELKNNTFKEELNGWTYTSATPIYKEGFYGKYHIHLKQNQTLSQTLNLEGANSYKIKGRIKTTNNTPCNIVVEGLYYVSNSQSGSIGGPSLDATLNAVPIEFVYTSDSSNNDWHEFLSSDFYILQAATNINANITVYADGDVYIDNLEVIKVSTSANILNNSTFDNGPMCWSTNEEDVEVSKNSVFPEYIYLEQGGSISRNLIPEIGDKYHFRGLVKHEFPSQYSASSASITLNCYCLNESTLTLEPLEIKKEVSFDYNVNGWYEFACDELEILETYLNPSVTIKVNATEPLCIKELYITNENKVLSNLINNSSFQNGESDFTTHESLVYQMFVASDDTNFILETDESISKSKVYGKNVLRIKGNKLNSQSTKTLKRKVKLDGQKGDTLTLNALVKFNENDEQSLKLYIKLINNTICQESYVTPSKYFSFYQTMTNCVVATSDYDEVEIGLEYNGLNDIYVTGIELSKTKASVDVAYDELENVTNVNKSYIAYNIRNQISKYINEEDASILTYNDKSEVIKITDLFGNIKEIEYNEDGKVTKEKVIPINNEPYEQTYSYEYENATRNNRAIISTDYFNNQTVLEEHKLDKYSIITYANEHSLTSYFNVKDQLTKLSSNSLNDPSNEIEYTNENNISKLKVNDTDAYEYIYDSFGRILKVKLKDAILEEYTYTSDSLLETYNSLTKKRKYVYDEKRRLKEIWKQEGTNETLLLKITYDRFDNIMFLKDIINNKTLHFTYDDKNNIAKTSELYTNNNTYITYDYENKTTKKTYSNLNHIKELSYEEKTNNPKKEAILKLASDYNADIVLGSLKEKGLFGITSLINENQTTYDDSINLKTVNFTESEQYLSYNLKTWNKDKLNFIKNNSVSSYKMLKADFDYNKTITLLVKPYELFNKRSFLKLYQNNATSPCATLEVQLDGKLTLKTEDETIITSTNALILNEWNVVTLSLIKDSAEDIITYYLGLNNEIDQVVSPIHFSVMNLSKVSIGEDNTNTRLLVFDLALIAFDSYTHTTSSLTKLMQDALNILNTKEETYTKTKAKTNTNTNEIEFLNTLNLSNDIIKHKLLVNGETKLEKTYTQDKTRITREEFNNNFINYTYDSLGNIQTKQSQGNQTTYTYDALGRLIKEENNNSQIIYSYNTNGNITTKQEYSLQGQTPTLLHTTTYTYNNIYKDRLDSYIVDQTQYFITYQNTLYPTNYKNNTITWDRGNIIQIGTNTYEYNSSNIRTKKTVGTKVHTYTLDNINIIKEHILDTTNNIDVTLEYIYDQSNQLVGVVEGNNVYYYDKDATNEIKGLVDTNGNYVVKYTYTAYGEVEKDILVNTNISTYNPFMYKGYYYDVETNLYYCKSRYYSPELCRWISPDSIEYLDPSSINGINLYAYCGNDPVNYFDPSGHAPQWLQIAGWVGLGVGILVCCVAIGILTAGVGTATFLGAVAVGAAKGALIGAAIGVGAGAIAGGAGAMIAGEEFGSSEFWSDVLYGGMLGFGAGAVVGAVAGGFHGANGWYNAKALEFTNVGSNEVVLGRSPGYVDVARSRGATYFHTTDDIWNATQSMRGVGSKGMWRINKAFLKQQIKAGAHFTLVDPTSGYFYAKEVAYVIKYGIYAFL